MDYEIIIKEILLKKIKIQKNSNIKDISDAIQKVKDDYFNEKIILDTDNFVSVSFNSN